MIVKNNGKTEIKTMVAKKPINADEYAKICSEGWHVAHMIEWELEGKPVIYIYLERTKLIVAARGTMQ